jgi:secreted trypsin-like serine protease
MEKQMNRIYLMIILVLAAVSFSPQKSHAIINGDLVMPSDRVALSTVGIIEDGARVCTGTLIRPNVVVTAAHCPTIGSVEAVRFGLNANDPNATTIVASAVYVHPGYDPYGYDNDIAVFILSAPATAPYIPVALMADAGDIAHNDKLVSVGYGRIDATTPTLGIMHKAIVSVLHASDEKVIFTMKQGPYGICFGDSGGPAYQLNNGALTLVGVANAVINYQCKGYGYFANVGAQRAWIESVIP